ncbi:uncharacterized protein Z519_06039 [Cladophialophora bantiana CBS 173.52]|uniref:Uncharacterized protein n=1 Tax=Cladophialophora bantiana (strain ATCC 10958 / CBS 173.52 / CDC B-1940 / NIH 8579) TaxID=1442370 RepID=A0A0D2I9I0_CLAB1|nr:uncharacterized protein Z519_06039 [Cladophialophora bantiana CBS 173.52]KIW93434.1 hypothetical protein Z519_06039 [Cladophialophora bantiana CBS 173.52]
MNRACTRLLRNKPPSAPLKVPTRRYFHPESRSFQNSAHGTHRFIYRWTIQAIGTPFAVAYFCEKISGRSDGESSFKLELSDIGPGLLTSRFG